MEMSDMSASNGADAEPSTSDSEPQTSGTTVSFHKITYKAPIHFACRHWFAECREKKKIIKPWQKKFRNLLVDVNGIMKPGLNAIMGPTGAGKTTLLNVLAGRNDPAGLTGDVLINSRPRPEDFKFMSGYVIQESTLTRNLTVRENLMFSAQLRLEECITLNEKKRIVASVIRQLGLDNVADSRVAYPGKPGISGGEVKRTNIGMELIVNPSVLFLDEPTSGLDANTAHTLLLQLQTMANEGHTIILTIHQPRYSIFELFESLTLLVRGKLAYHGPATQALVHFSTLGYTCEDFNNPADFLLDVISGNFKPKPLNDSNSGASPDCNNGAFPDSNTVQENQDNEDPLARKQKIVENLIQDYQSSEYRTETQTELEAIERKRLRGTTDSLNDTTKNTWFFTRIFGTFRKVFSTQGCYKSSFFTQFKLVFRRSFRQLCWVPRTWLFIFPFPQSWIRWLNAVFLSVIILSLFNNHLQNQQGIQNRFGVFFFIVLNQLYGGMTASEQFRAERRLYNHQYRSGYYRVSSYFLGTTLSDLVLRIKPVSMFLFLFFSGLNSTGFSIPLFLLTMILVAFAGATVALAWTITENDAVAIALVMNLIVLGMTFFAGLLVNMSSVNKLDFLKYLSVAHYGCTALRINEFVGLNFTINATEAVFNQTGEDILMEQGIVDYSPLGFWKNIIALVLINIWCLFIAYTRLRFLTEQWSKWIEWPIVTFMYGLLFGALFTLAYSYTF